MDRERLPPTMNMSEFQARFEQLPAGAELRYHTGLLIHDRLTNPLLDEIAEAALVLATDVDIEPRPAYKDGNATPAVIGLGRALLVQRHNCTGHEYLIIKRSL